MSTKIHNLHDVLLLVRDGAEDHQAVEQIDGNTVWCTNVRAATGKRNTIKLVRVRREKNEDAWAARGTYWSNIPNGANSAVCGEDDNGRQR